jgi:molecular chaperone GrpE
MTGTDESGRDSGEWDPDAEKAGGSPSGPEPGSGGPPGDEDDEVEDAEILDEAEVSAAVDAAFADADPLNLALNQRDEYLDSLRRLQAEFENYKKRVAKQQSDQVAREAASLIAALLPVLDTLDLATEHIGDEESVDGRALLAVAGQLHDVLAKEGLERDYPLGEEFDPNAHEAVGHLPDEAAEGGGSSDAGSDKQVVGQVMRAGYRWRGAVVRPAMVMVRG